ncbi:MAG: sugar transferase, partial [Eubacterium sp.]|nr:sugar transferase [Eubacterium sp.]
MSTVPGKEFANMTEGKGNNRRKRARVLEIKHIDGRTEEIIINHSILYMAVKRFFDVILSLLALVVMSPVFLITAIAIKLEDGDPVVFTQDRSGLDGTVFRMYKFRSMVKNAPELHKSLLDKN